MKKSLQKILIVDDEHLVADTLRLIFEKRGYECRASYSGREALACIETFIPQLLLCDITMPGMDGMEVAASVLNKVQGCRVLMLTGHYANLRTVIPTIRSLKVPNGVMIKPVLPEDLLQEARELLQTAS